MKVKLNMRKLQIMRTEYFSFNKDIPNPYLYSGRLYDPMPNTEYIFKLPRPILGWKSNAMINVEESYHARIKVIDSFTFSVVWDKLINIGSIKSRAILVIIPME